MKKIGMLRKQKLLDRSDSVIKNFWEIEDSRSVTSGEDIREKLIELISCANEVIIIRTSRLYDAEIIEALSDAWLKRKVRVYGILSGIPEALNLEFGVFHTSEGIKSSYILVDPKSAESSGLWWNTSKMEDVTFCFELKGDMIRELWGHFTQEFWASEEAIVLGNVKQRMKPDRRPPEIPLSLKKTSRGVSLNFLYNVRQLYLPEELFNEKNIDIVLDATETAKEITVPLKEISHEVVEDALEDGKKVLSGDIPAGLAIGDSGGVLFMSDIMFKLDTKQTEEVLKKFKKNGKFYQEKRLGDVQGIVIFQDSNWESPESLITVDDEATCYIPPVRCDNIDEWLSHYEIIPEVPEENQLPLARKINLIYEVHPPYLPKDAKRHSIYTEWEDFRNTYKRVLDMIKSKCKKISHNGLKEGDKIALEGKLSEINATINRMESEIDNWFGKKVSASKAVKELEELSNQTGIISYTYQNDNDEEPNELEFVIATNSDDDKITELLKRLRQIPETVPEVGELYNSKHRNYLTIENTHEIEPAKKEAERFNAIVCVKEEGGKGHER